MKISFSGINIQAKSPAKSFEFYKGIGFPVKTEAMEDDKWYGAEFDLGGESTLWIWRDNSGDTRENAGRATIVIVINCEDMDATYTDLTAKGYTVTAPETQFYGGREMNLIDPDGNRLLFLD